MASSSSSSTVVQDSSFEWLVDPKELVHLLLSSALGIGETGDVEARVCVVGCGRSRLGHALRDQCGYRWISSFDNDANVVADMRARYGKDDPRMTWIQADITQPFAPKGSFDLCVDKGTLDAVLCAKEAATDLICQVHRVLAERGVYVIVSLHPETFLKPLLSIPAIGFELKCSTIPCLSGGSPRTACVLRKKDGSQAPRNIILKHQLAVMNKHFQQDAPLLTPSRRVAIYEAFGGDVLSLAEAHRRVFTDDERTEYSLDDFCADVNSRIAAEGKMSFQDALEFLEQNQ